MSILKCATLLASYVRQGTATPSRQHRCAAGTLSCTTWSALTGSNGAETPFLPLAAFNSAPARMVRHLNSVRGGRERVCRGHCQTSRIGLGNLCAQPSVGPSTAQADMATPGVTSSGRPTTLLAELLDMAVGTPQPGRLLPWRTKRAEVK